MDWNPKTPLQWDWENLALFTGKEMEIAKPAQQPEWRAEGGGGIGKGSMHSSVGGACSGSDLGNGSSRSSISASIDSSSKTGTKVSEFNFETAERFPKNPDKSKQLTRVEDTGTSPAVLASAGPREPLIGLKLGKRTYFEDATAGNSTKNSSSASAMQPAASAKKSRVSQQSVQSSYCQVEGCNIDLSTAKDYHRKHRVCENHAKSPKVVVAGQERRFCQQCSRFHDLSEFDQKKRSCRRRLSDHNARRRKPQPEAISFNSSRLSSSFYDRQQMNLFFSRSPFGHMRTTASSSWETSSAFKLTQPKGSWANSTKLAGVEGQLHFASTLPSNNQSTPHHDVDKLLSFKSSTAEVLDQGLEASTMASNLDGAPDLRRALSLLSTDSWGSANPGPTSHVQFATTIHTTAANPAVHAINSNPGFWQDEQPLPQQARVLSFDLHSNGSQFEEFQLHKTPFETAFFDSSQIH